MKLGKIEKDVIKEICQLSVVDGYFYLTETNKILRGFVYEKTRNGAYIWKWYFPLYQKIDNFHLTFGDRIDHPEGYIDFDYVSVKERSKAFIELIKKYLPEVSSLSEPFDFINYQVAHSRYWAKLTNSEPRFNEHTCKALAFSYFLCDDIESGKTYWEKYLESGRHEQREHLKEEFELVDQALGENLDSLKLLLNSWVCENKQKFNIAEK
ncbi:hypothetical protein [Pseudoalteromonas sp. H71]|uniref:hypothetical protein n=1 Tax=Pseudoalteromonas sp. H71 TaxID=1348395 RepID=UPI00073043A3|nr:hypothetical protein [Pseudoalteromonas sp. H71]KTD97758.1 hypothetical protein ATS71_03900 [Pseudoalteromonas sp. H71]